MEKRVTGLTLDEFLSYGPQREPSNVINQFLRVFPYSGLKND